MMVSGYVCLIYLQWTDLTLASEDEWDYDAHKEILAAPSPNAINISN